MGVLRAAVVTMLAMTLLTGVAYPGAVLIVARAIFPERASGSLVLREGVVVGSGLVGQAFVDDRYFHPRPSATSGTAYNAMASGASNLAPSSPLLLGLVRDRVAGVRARGVESPVPIDLVTVSASGLDPHVSPASALLQVPRVARARGLTEGAVRELVESLVETRDLGVLGEPRVNVLLLNLRLDALEPASAAR